MCGCPGVRVVCGAAAAAKSLQSCLTLCDPIDGSPSGSSVHGILQARILEWVAISVSIAGARPMLLPPLVAWVTLEDLAPSDTGL